MRYEDVIGFYKKWVEPFFALVVLLMVVILVAKLTAYNNFQEEIATNCGWEEEDTRCFCQKGDVIAAENEIKGQYGGIDLSLDNDYNS